MHIDLERRQASLSVGEFSDFMPGPREAAGEARGLWRAQLGSRWHRELQAREVANGTPARFEVVLNGAVRHRGWTLSLTGRIDQLLEFPERRLLREVKTVLHPLPAEAAELRAAHPAWFIQAALYAMLLRQEEATGTALAAVSAELVFVEADSGLLQSVPLDRRDEALLEAQLERVTGFLEQRWQSRERLRHMRISSPFAQFRSGQEEALARLKTALAGASSTILFEAPTGFGKTGILLDAALGAMKNGRFDRLVYLTSKATGQLHVIETLGKLCAPQEEAAETGTPLSQWLVRPKSEHCVNDSFRCHRDLCPYLRDLPHRWTNSGVQLICQNPESKRGIADLREAGRAALVCPYEITRAALPFADVWVGDINYVFDPGVCSLFMEQPGFLPEQTLLIVDEAHNLPSRVADAYSQVFEEDACFALAMELRRLRAGQSLLRCFDAWTQFLSHLHESKALSLADEEDALHMLGDLAQAILVTPLDTVSMDPGSAEQLWAIVAFMENHRAQPSLERLWWSPKRGVLSIVCLNAAPAIAETLKLFGAVLLSSATFGPTQTYQDALGLDGRDEDHKPESLSRLSQRTEELPPAPPRLGKLTKRQTKALLSKVTNAAELLRVEEEREAAALTLVSAQAPWREHAYEVAVDLRVDTRFQHRESHYLRTAETLRDWHELAAIRDPLCTVFFPSYAYAETIQNELRRVAPALRHTLQPRGADLAEQTAWLQEALTTSDILFLVLGSSFAEGIDLLGGKVRRALVVGPALPEVNPVQQARMDSLARLGRNESFRRIYQIPGIQKVNQALGRLVRAPGHTARILLHCQRFADPGYEDLLQPEYRQGQRITDDPALHSWFASPGSLNSLQL